MTMVIMLQLVLALLILAVFYGVSFIVDMIFRRYYANIVLYVVVMLVLIGIHRGIDAFYWFPLAVSLVAVLLASWSVRALQNRGYRMFQRTKKEDRQSR